MKKPLQGVRVLDLGIITAGAATGALLADMGAEVIKIESPHYQDPFRDWALGGPAAEEPGKLHPFFRATNRNKTGLSIDLKTAEGHEAFLRLVAQSDVVVENFRRGVLPKLDLDFAVMQRVNPNIILASISSQGDFGPDAEYVSFGSTLEAMGGLAWLTGYEGEAPIISGNDLNYPDQVAAIFAAGMICAALCDLKNGGSGVHLDLSQRELTSFLSSEAFAQSSASTRLGNTSAPYVLQDCFASQDGKWIALSVRAQDILALSHCMAVNPDTLAAPDSLRHAVSQWIRAQPHQVAITTLLAAGVAAAQAVNGQHILDQPGWHHAAITLADGALVKGFPFQLDNAPLSVASDAPYSGEHSRMILRQLANYQNADIENMIANRVIAVPS